MSKKPHYAKEFKKQIVKMYNEGKPTREILQEYGMSKSTLHQWVKDYNNTGSFKAKDNRSIEENELIELRKRNKQLEMEVDILKQAALIMAKR